MRPHREPEFRRDASDEALHLRLLGRPVAPQKASGQYGSANRATVGPDTHAGLRSTVPWTADSDRSFARPRGLARFAPERDQHWSGGPSTSATAGVTPPRRVMCEPGSPNCGEPTRPDSARRTVTDSHVTPILKP